jgi:hypothetical protein
LLNPSKASSVSGTLTTTYISGTRYRIQGLASGNKVFMASLGIPSDTYTLSITLVSGSYSGGNLVIQDQSNTTLGELTIGALGTKVTKTVTGTIGRLILWNTQTFDGTFDIQIELGSKANSYSAYGTTPIELCKIGDYQDYIYKDNGNWYLHKEIGKVVLDGSETWHQQNTGTSGKYRFCVDIGTNIFSTSTSNLNAPIFSDKLKTISRDNSYLLNNGDGIAPTDPSYFYKSFIVYIEATSSMNASQFATWLASNNITVYYILATPTDTLIEDTTLISQLDALESQ